MSIAAYQTLYENSLAFAVRKAILAESEKLELEQKVQNGPRAEPTIRSTRVWARAQHPAVRTHEGHPGAVR